MAKKKKKIQYLNKTSEGLLPFKMWDFSQKKDISPVVLFFQEFLNQ